MPRIKRVWYPGAQYHIMNRGNRRSNLFREDEDYEIYLAILKCAKERYNFQVYGYCLMTNHVHIQMKTGVHEIWDIMHFITLSYTKYFNEKYKLIGHLFQGRYRAEIIEKDDYTLQISRYIHLNPVRAKMVVAPQDYKWSSYCIFIDGLPNEFVSKEKILQYFLDDSVELYQQFVLSKSVIDTTFFDVEVE